MFLYDKEISGAKKTVFKRIYMVSTGMSSPRFENIKLSSTKP